MFKKKYYDLFERRKKNFILIRTIFISNINIAKRSFDQDENIHEWKYFIYLLAFLI